MALSCLVLHLGYGRGLMDRAAAERKTAELVAEYGSPDACPGVLLCDRHPGEAVAFTVVEPDLSYRDLTLVRWRPAGAASCCTPGSHPP